MKSYYVYILSNKENSVLYVGVTNDLERRVYEHKFHHFSGFTSKYNVNKLVYFEETSDIYEAITREKELKGKTRAKKVALINFFNPNWIDLSIE